MDKKERKKQMLDEMFGEYNGEYIGNMWGWKVSFIGLGVLLFFLALMAYRHHQIGDWNMMTEEERIELQKR